MISYSYFIFFSERAARGGGDAARLFFFFFFPCLADHERDWPPCEIVFFGLATNALNVRNRWIFDNMIIGFEEKSERIQTF